MNQGKILEVVGARVDIDFSGGELPAMFIRLGNAGTIRC